MALVLADRVKETTTTTGAGTITLAGASQGYQSFAVIGNGNTTFYCISGQTTSEWEVGIGTYTSAGTTLARTTVLANSAGTQPTALTFSAGTKDVFVTYPASKSVNLDASGNVSALGTVASGTWSATTIAANKGGTGQTTYVVGDVLYADTTSTLAKLADVATGNALISGGVGVAPSYGKIGLTTHVSGTLPIANGGTNTTATPTGGAVAYGTGSAYAFTAAGTSGQVLTSAGASSPTWTTATNANTASAIVQRDASGNFSAGTITANLTGNASGLSATLAVSSGGTGVTTLTGLAYGNGTSAFTAATAAQVVSVIGTTAVTNATNATTATNATNATYTASGTSGSGGAVYENAQTIASNYTMTSGYNGMSAGPITINTGVTVTIPTGSVWSIV